MGWYSAVWFGFKINTLSAIYYFVIVLYYYDNYITVYDKYCQVTLVERKTLFLCQTVYVVSGKNTNGWW